MPPLHDALPLGDTALTMTFLDDGLNNAGSAQSITTQGGETCQVATTTLGGDTCPLDIISAVHTDIRQSVTAHSAEITEGIEDKRTSTTEEEDRKAKRRRKKELEMAAEGTEGKKRSEDREKKVKRRKSKDESKEKRDERRRLSKEGKSLDPGSSSSRVEGDKSWEASLGGGEQRVSSSSKEGKILDLGASSSRVEGDKSWEASLGGWEQHVSSSAFVGSEELGSDAQHSTVSTPSGFVNSETMNALAVATPSVSQPTCDENIDARLGSPAAHRTADTENDAIPSSLAQQSTENESGLPPSSPVCQNTENRGKRSASLAAVESENAEARPVSPAAQCDAPLWGEDVDAHPASPSAQGSAPQGSENVDAHLASPSAQRSTARGSEHVDAHQASPSAQGIAARGSENVDDHTATEEKESLLAQDDATAQQDNQNNGNGSAHAAAYVIGEASLAMQTAKEAWAPEKSDDLASLPVQTLGEFPSMGGSASRSRYFDSAMSCGNVPSENAVHAQAEGGGRLVKHATPLEGTGVIDETGNASTTRAYFEHLGLSEDEKSVSIDAHPDQMAAAENEGLDGIPTVAGDLVGEVSNGQAPNTDPSDMFFTAGDSCVRMNYTSGEDFVSSYAHKKHTSDERFSSSGIGSGTESNILIRENTLEESVVERDRCALKVDVSSLGGGQADEACTLEQARQRSKGAISSSSSAASAFVPTSEPARGLSSPLGQQEESCGGLGADNQGEPRGDSRAEELHSQSVNPAEGPPCHDSKTSSHGASLPWATASLDAAIIAKLESLSETDDVTCEAPPMDVGPEHYTIEEQAAKEHHGSRPESFVDECPWGFPPEYGDDWLSHHSSLDERPWGFAQDPRANDGQNAQSRDSSAPSVLNVYDLEETPLEAAALVQGESTSQPNQNDPASLLDQNDSTLLPDDSRNASVYVGIHDLEETPSNAAALVQGEIGSQTDQNDSALLPEDNGNAPIHGGIRDQVESPLPPAAETLPSTPLSFAAVALHSLLPGALLPEENGNTPIHVGIRDLEETLSNAAALVQGESGLQTDQNDSAVLPEVIGNAPIHVGTHNQVESPAPPAAESFPSTPLSSAAVALHSLLPGALLPEDNGNAPIHVGIRDLEETPSNTAALVQGESGLQTDQNDSAVLPEDNGNAPIHGGIRDIVESPLPPAAETLPSTPLSSAAVALHSLLPGALLPEDNGNAPIHVGIRDLEETPSNAAALVQGESGLQADQNDSAVLPEVIGNAPIHVGIRDQVESPAPPAAEALPSSPLSSASVALPEQCVSALPPMTAAPPRQRSRSPTNIVGTTTSTTPTRPERARPTSPSPTKRSQSPEATVSLYAKTAQQRGLSPALNRTIKYRSKSPGFYKVNSFWNEFQRLKVEARKKDKFPRVQDILDKVRVARQRVLDEDDEDDNEKEKSVPPTSASPPISAGAPSSPVVPRVKQRRPRPLTADVPQKATDSAAKRVSMSKEFCKRLQMQQRNVRTSSSKSEKKVDDEFNLSTQCPMSFEGFVRKVGVPTQWSKEVKKQIHNELPSMQTRQRNLAQTAHAMRVLPADRSVFSLVTGSDTIQYRNPDISRERSEALGRRNFAAEIRSRKNHESHIF